MDPFHLLIRHYIPKDENGNLFIIESDGEKINIDLVRSKTIYVLTFYKKTSQFSHRKEHGEYGLPRFDLKYNISFS